MIKICLCFPGSSFSMIKICLCFPGSSFSMIKICLCFPGSSFSMIKICLCFPCSSFSIIEICLLYVSQQLLLLQCNRSSFCLVFNSRTAIAGAIIGLLLVFYNSKNLNCIGALSFLRLEEEYWSSPFLQFKEFELYWGAVFFF